jgi:metal-dependent amidase/aminoacylase/carboxypeptidase family protein
VQAAVHLPVFDYITMINFVFSAMVRRPYKGFIFENGQASPWISEQIEACRDELIALRRDFHRHPELGFEEHRTASVVEAYLQDLGLSTRRIAKTGVVALLEGSGPGPVLMLRADMDALPVTEENEFAYRSQNPGVMHACGHDAHMAMLLVAAKILSQHTDAFAGTIKLSSSPTRRSPAPFA